MQVIAAALIGLIFGTGIVISGMGNPAKVLAFFDFAGDWDPSLAFVMGGALLVTAVGYRFVFNRGAPLLAPAFNVPMATQIDAPLVLGSAVFGVGWGITGFCPGAAVPMLAIGSSAPVLFFIGFVVGLVATRQYRVWAAERRLARQPIRTP
jgi:uncharacterized membrane protein YedE/YeeE